MQYHISSPVHMPVRMGCAHAGFACVLVRCPQVIKADLERKHADLLASFGCDVKEVNELFNAHKDVPVLSKNSAPHSGT